MDDGAPGCCPFLTPAPWAPDQSPNRFYPPPPRGDWSPRLSGALWLRIATAGGNPAEDRRVTQSGIRPCCLTLVGKRVEPEREPQQAVLSVRRPRCGGHAAVLLRLRAQLNHRALQ